MQAQMENNKIIKHSMELMSYFNLIYKNKKVKKTITLSINS